MKHLRNATSWTARTAWLPSLILAAGCASAPQAIQNPWSDIKTPAPGPAMVYGGYAAGCVQGAVSLPPDGRGYQMMRLTRRRFYGHPGLVGFVQGLGERVWKARLGTILVGDLGQPRGGPSLSGHKSHQTGLDVDIWFWRPAELETSGPKPARSLRLDEREELSATSLVTPDGLYVNNEAWKPAYAKILKLAAEAPEVERIFVNAAIKRRICDEAGNTKRDWLRKLRPWYGHDDHFHVRLRCPEGSQCQPNDPIPEGDGCDSSLDWWFTAEAREPKPGEKPAEPKLPALPDACSQLLPPAPVKTEKM